MRMTITIIKKVVRWTRRSLAYRDYAIGDDEHR